MMNIINPLALCALLAIVLACVWLPKLMRETESAAPKRHKGVQRSWRKFTQLPSMAALMTSLISGRSPRMRVQFANVETDVGIHEGGITKKADAALAARYLLVKVGTDIDHIAVCAAADKPLGPCTDEPGIGDVANVDLLGIASHTFKMRASEAFAAGVDVYTAANGKIQDEPAVAGTYWKVGRSLTASSGDNALVEVKHHAPIKMVVIAALTSTDGTAAGAADLAALKAEAEKIGDDVRAIGAALATPALVKVLPA